MILQPPLVAAQPLFDALGGLVGAGIGIGRHRLRFQHDAGIEMDHAFGAEAEAVLADGHVTGIAAVEIFRGRFGDPLVDAAAQRLADVDVLARNAKRHGCLRSSHRGRCDDATLPYLYDARNAPLPCQCKVRHPRTQLRTSGAPRSQAAFRAGAAPTTESAWPRDISRPSAARCRCRPRCSFSTIVSSDSTSCAAFGVDQLLDAVTHRLGRCASPPSASTRSPR